MISSVFYAYDNHNTQMLAVWEPEIYALENKAKKIITAEKIDCIFNVVSNAIQNDLWTGYCNFIERCRLEDETGLENEILDCIPLPKQHTPLLAAGYVVCTKRDISWLIIELQLGQKGFFSKLLSLYERGRWPCSYKGVYPNGKFIVM